MSGAGIIVRDARAEEREAVRTLTMGAYGEYASVMEPSAWAGLEQALRTALSTDGPAEWIVAERGGRIVGSVMLYPPATDAYAGAAARMRWPELRLLSVAPEVRGGRVGQALVDECVRRARRMGAEELGLHTSRSMAAARRMYRRMGFVRAPEHDFQPGGAELVEGYRLVLDRA
jgi:predicted N-acetyltransferase YhbS